MVTSRGSKSTYESWKEAQDKTYLGWMEGIGRLAFFAYLIVQRETVAEVLGLGSSSIWKFVLLLVAIHVIASVGLGVSSSMAYGRLGIVYTEDRTAFALAGGFDVGRVPMLVAQAGTYALCWWSWNSADDPLNMVRSPWLYLLISGVAGLLLVALTAMVVFRRRPGRTFGPGVQGGSRAHSGHYG